MSLRASPNKPGRKARAFSSGSSVWLARGSGCGSAVASRWPQSSGRRQPQNPALPACGESCWSVKPTAMALPLLLQLPCPGHRWVIRAWARGLRCFQLPPINPQSGAPFQLHRSGLAETMQLEAESLTQRTRKTQRDWEEAFRKTSHQTVSETSVDTVALSLLLCALCVRFLLHGFGLE